MSGIDTLNRRSVLIGACSTLLALRSAAMAPERWRIKGPLMDSAKGRLVWNVADNGYTAEEYLLEGFADIYESVSMADALDTNTRDNVADQAHRAFPLKRLADAKPYVTRLVVYRPTAAARFSGNVIVETTHPTGGGRNIVWSDINGFFMAHGDAYVAVQHPATLPGLAQADSDRYGSLRAEHPSQLWGMLADTGRILRSADGKRILGGTPARRLYMTGYSFTGVATATFANYHHDKTRGPGGAPIFNGYMPMANAMYVRPLDVPVMRINTQSDFDSFGALGNRTPDSDAAAGRFRHYEVAGASHVWAERPQAASAKPDGRPPIPPPGGKPHIDAPACLAAFPKGSLPNDFPLNLLLTRAFENLYAWVDRDTPPPRGEHLQVDARGNTQLDENGNALGGVRLPEVSVPLATYGVGKGGQCWLFGYRMPFDLEKRKALYGGRDQYALKVQAAAQQLVAGRWIQPQGADELVRAAQASELF